jgi:hypothetical protein
MVPPLHHDDLYAHSLADGNICIVSSQHFVQGFQTEFSSADDRCNTMYYVVRAWDYTS